MSDKINDIISGILAREGGYVNHPDDPGRATNRGITQDTADEHGLGPVKDITEAQTRTFYYNEYIVAPNFDTLGPLSEAVMEEAVDTGVHCGMGVAAQHLQQALNFFNRNGRDYPDIEVDGLVGSKTRSALRSYLKVRSHSGEKVLTRAQNTLQGAYYFHIGERNEKLESFAFGWFLHRVVV